MYADVAIVPLQYEQPDAVLPLNVTVLNIEEQTDVKFGFSDFWNCFRIVCSDFRNYPSKTDFIKTFRYNLTLVKNLHTRAAKISRYSNWFRNEAIVYAYWADDLATTACIIHQKYHKVKVVTRGHGFEVFEEQTRYGVIPFRSFQYRYLSKLYTDSKRGLLHLNANPKYQSYKGKNDCAYVGTPDKGMSPFSEQAVFSIVTCSFVRSIKRLHLLPEILKHISANLVWHVLGDGEDLPKLKELSSTLPSNINVIFHGALSNEAILDFYAQHSLNLFVSLSSSEGLPVSMMEVLSFGIPIMSTDVGGCNEICNEQTGFLIEKEFNPAEVAKKIETFKNSHKNTTDFHKQCRRFWQEQFSAETNYKRFAETITKL